MTRQFSTAAGPHLKPARSVRQVMLMVLIALIPGIAAHVWFFGTGILIQIILAVLFAVFFEAVMLKLRKRPLQPFISDLSAPLTGVLFALAIPPLSPWWIAAIGMLFAIVIAKHLYGGIGFNLFNPAMVGLAVVLVSFPRQYTQWLPPAGLGESIPSIVDTLPAIFSGQLPAPWQWDTLAQATPLDTVKIESALGKTMSEIRQDQLFGDFGGRGWEWIANFYAIGGLFLLWKRIIPWYTPVATLTTTFLLTVPFWMIDPDSHPMPLSHIFSGALVFAAFFIVTDPVSGCTTPRGRLIFGAGVAILTLAIRRWGSFADGVAFAVLLMNCAAPLIDRYSRPQIFGQQRSSQATTSSSQSPIDRS